MRLRVAGCVAALALASALQPPSAAPQSPDASVYLEPDHWAYDAVRRLASLGLLPPGRERGFWSQDRGEALALMDAALAAALADRPGLARVLRGYRDRLRAELGEAAGGGPRAPAPAFVLGRSAASAGYEGERGVVLTALGGPDFVEEEPVPIPDEAAPLAELDLVARGGGRWAARLRARAVDGAGPLGEAYGRLDLWNVELWAGRRTLRLGAGEGNVILRGSTTLGGGGVETDPFRLPWVLDRIGLVRGRMALVRMEEVTPFEHPWLWVVRVGIEPHPRVTLGLNRSAMVAASTQKDAEFVRHLLYVLIGKHGAGERNRQDNHIASVDLTYRPPLGDLPLLLHLEWGLEDSAGAWRDVPGIVAGAYVGAVPGAPWLALGIERAGFSESCCGNPWWYRHRGFLAGWTEERRPLGHDMGGQGTEWSARASASLLEGAIQTRLRVYRRDRGDENLFAPLRAGLSAGGTLDLSILPRPDVRFSVAAGLEDGGEWSAGQLRVALSYLFGGGF